MLPNTSLLHVQEATLAEGGVLTIAHAVVPHLHIEIDDDISVFGLAIPRSGGTPGEDRIAHLSEHMIMRCDRGEGELHELLELFCSSGWWQAITTARCIAFEVASYTPDCFWRSASALSGALFGLRICADQFASEADPLFGRMGTELAAEPSLRASLLARAAQALIGIVPDNSTSSVEAEELRNWHRANVSPHSVLWFTYGRMQYAAAALFVSNLLATFEGSSDIERLRK